MKRRKFMGLLAALPFAGSFFAKAVAKSALVPATVAATNVRIVLVRDGMEAIAEIWSDGPVGEPSKEEVIWYTERLTDVETGKVAEVLTNAHVWTRRLCPWSDPRHPARVIIARLPATPEVLNITYGKRHDELASRR